MGQYDLTSTPLLKILKEAWESDASDIHLREEEPVILRLDGDLHPYAACAPSAGDIHAFIDPMLNAEQKQAFQQTLELDFAHQVGDLCRIRVNLFQQRQQLCAAIRLLPMKIRTMEELYLPKACHQFISLHKGLVLVTGPTGSGKSTTLASMIDAVNTQRRCHILTIEDPIEYVYQNKKAMISQREVGHDTQNFAAALRHAFRQDPDVVLLGEMRDLETMQMSITLAETGHLTFSTLHTGEAARRSRESSTPFRRISRKWFACNWPIHSLASYRNSSCPSKIRKAEWPPAKSSWQIGGVKNLIRENKLEQITTAIQTGTADGMFTMNYSLGHLYKSGHISYETAYQASFDMKDFQSKYGVDSR